MAIKNALISCHDKTGLKYFASELVKLNPGVRIYSSGGTFKEIEAVAKDNVVEISSYTGFAEMPSGLVKTLHPKIHAGILADLSDEKQRKYLEENEIVAFDLVVVNLYPFSKAVKEGKGFEDARKNMDVGGVSLLEAAAKNFLRVAVVCDIKDYEPLLEMLRKGELDKGTKLELAKKAIAVLDSYIAGINEYFKGLKEEDI